DPGHEGRGHGRVSRCSRGGRAGGRREARHRQPLHPYARAARRRRARRERGYLPLARFPVRPLLRGGPAGSRRGAPAALRGEGEGRKDRDQGPM
ncbi:MAG: Ferredoxin, 2Fe-2S, partial [uncultured Rubrobacteraceae bacterium]